MEELELGCDIGLAVGEQLSRLSPSSANDESQRSAHSSHCSMPFFSQFASIMRRSGRSMGSGHGPMGGASRQEHFGMPFDPLNPLCGRILSRNANGTSKCYGRYPLTCPPFF